MTKIYNRHRTLIHIIPYVQRMPESFQSFETIESNGGPRRVRFFFLFFLLRSYHRSCRPPDRDTISLSPRTRVMPRWNDSALSCIRSNHSLFDVGVTSLYAVLLDPGVCYSNHGAALFLMLYSGDFSRRVGSR